MYIEGSFRSALLTIAADARVHISGNTEYPWSAGSLSRQPFVERGRRDAGPVAGQQHVARHRRVEDARPRRYELHRVAARIVGTPRHVDEVLRLRAGDVGVAALRLAHRDLGDHVGDVLRRDRLHEQRRDRGDAVALGPAGDHRGEVVKLRGRDDRPRQWTFGDEALLLAFAGVVRGALDATDP